MNEILKKLLDQRKTWLITGAAGFIGSNICEFLLKNNQKVIAIDNFATGFKQNINFLENQQGIAKENFVFHDIAIESKDLDPKLFAEADYVLHQAALGSVPRSIVDPVSSCNANIHGFVNVMKKAVENDISAFVFASSSSVYGDIDAVTKTENELGKPLSPYALTKKINEDYSEMFSKIYGFNSVGLRYFNVFGPRQNPDGPYSAVIPKWIKKMLSNEDIEIYGDGTTSRDFCYIQNVIHANLLSAAKSNEIGVDFFNVAYGETTTLNELFQLIREELAEKGISYNKSPIYKDFRQGDVKHSLADLGKSKKILNYEGTVSLREGLKKTVEYYLLEFKN